MKHILKTSCLAALGMILTATAAHAQSAPPSLEVMRAMNGLWVNAPPPRPAGQPAPPPPSESTVNDRRFPPALEALMQPWARAGYDKYKHLAATVVDKEPPTPDNMCLPFAMPGEGVSTSFPTLIMVTPKVVGIHTQIDTQMRLVHMDGKHPVDLKPSMHGHAVGHWEGDTLVIESTGFDDRAQFNDGLLHSPKLKVVERFRLIEDGKILERQFTFTDEDAFTGPYSFTRRSRRSDEPFQEYLNAQNNRLYPCPTADKGSTYQPFR